MRSFRVLTLGLALLGAVVAPALAGTFKFDKAQVELTSPEGWKSEEKDGVVTFTSPDDALAVVFLILPAKEAEKASEFLDKEIEKVTGPVKWPEKGEAQTINGMEYDIWDGKAKEGALDVSAAYINTPAEEIMVCYYVATPEAGKKYEKQIVEILQGIKPIGGAAEEGGDGEGEAEGEEEGEEEGEGEKE